MTDLTHLAALQRYWKRHKAFPAMAKLCEVVGLSSTASVFGMVARMVDAGYLARVDGRIAPGARFFARPLLGTVRAGQPQARSQEEPEALTLDDYLIDAPDRTSLHKVRGDSMHDAGIFDGDLVVVEHNCPTRPGDIVVAVVDDELTVKTLAIGPEGAYFLEPANPAFQSIHPKASLELLGVVISVVRRVRR